MSQVESDDHHVDILIVGAGFAGLYALHRARSMGFTAAVIERAHDVGGTWLWNRYPGCRCDVESIHYSYSFDEQLQQKWNWTEKYATQPEILSYARHVADRFKLRTDIRFNTELERLEWSEETETWMSTQRSVNSGDISMLSSTWVIMASGALSVPKPFDLPGQEAFLGEILHTHDWPETAQDFAGKRVAVIGTGSTGIQVIPEIAKSAAEVIVLQRTPSYVIPAGNRVYSEAERMDVKSRYAEIREQSKSSRGGIALETTQRPATDFTTDEVIANLQRAYDAGNPFMFSQMFSDVLVNTKSNRLVRDFLEAKISERIRQKPELASTVIPHGYPFGTRRMCLDTDYYETLASDHVEVIDLRLEPLEGACDRGLQVGERVVDADVIVIATGFDALTGALLAIDIAGINGKTLKEHWADGPRSYLGVGMAGFPNLFMVTGPGSPSVLSNVIHSIELHVEWITELMRVARDSSLPTVQVLPDAEESWRSELAETANTTLFEFANSWYVGSNVPGKPRVVLPYLSGVDEYRARINEVAERDYKGFRFSNLALEGEKN